MAGYKLADPVPISYAGSEMGSSYMRSVAQESPRSVMPTLQDKPVGHTATVKRSANTPIKAYSPPAMRNVGLPEPRPVGHTATLNVMQ